MSDIKMILFDLGGVLVEIADLSNMWAEKKTNYPEDHDFWPLWLADKNIHAIDRGLMEVEDFLKNWKEDRGIEADIDELRKIYQALIKEPFPGALELVKDCKKKYTVGCFSNMTYGHWPKIKSFAFEKEFSFRFVSWQIQFCKPESEAYQYVLQQLPFEKDEILFIDDNQLNVDKALEMGMQALRAKTAVVARQRLEELGLLT